MIRYGQVTHRLATNKTTGMRLADPFAGMHGIQSGPVCTAASSPHPRPNRGDAIMLAIPICRLPGFLPRYRLRVLSQTVASPLPQYGSQEGGKRSGF